MTLDLDTFRGWMVRLRGLYLGLAWGVTLAALLLAGEPLHSPVSLAALGCGLLSFVGFWALPASARARLFLWSLLALAALGTLARVVLPADRYGLAVDLVGILVVAGVVVGDLRARHGGYRSMLVVAVLLVTLAAIGAETVERAMQAGLWASTLLLVVGLVLRYQDRTASLNEQRLQDSRREAMTDILSGLMNRRGWQEQASRAYTAAQRQRCPITLVMIDADHFKDLNDRHGHLAGDAAIGWLGRHVETTGRHPEDVCARLGGDEYALLWFNCDAEAGQRRATQLRERVAEAPMQYEGHSIPLTISLGLCQFTPDEGQSLDLALASADTALYAAKASGRNRVATQYYLSRRHPGTVSDR